MQIKMTLRFHLTPVRTTKIKNTNDSLCWTGGGIIKTLLLQVGVKACTATLEINVVASHKIGNQSTSRPRYTTFRHLSKGCCVLPKGLAHLCSS